MQTIVRRKLVIVGDGACGKVCLVSSWRASRHLTSLFSRLQTCLLIVFSRGTFPEVSLNLAVLSACAQATAPTGLRPNSV